MTHPSQGRLYGRGVFTTIAVFGGEPFLWKKHWRRISINAEALGIDLSAFPEDDVKGRLQEALEVGKISEGRARVTFYDDRPSDVWPTENTAAPPVTISVLAAPRKKVSRPFRCALSPFVINSRSALAGVKSCNYLENVLALEDARRGGSSESLRANERGHIAGACMANVFWLKGDRMFTPSLSTGCLPGTTREHVLENVECEQATAARDEVERADAVFLTSAGLGVIAVDEFNGRRMRPIDHPILHVIPKTA